MGPRVGAGIGCAEKAPGGGGAAGGLGRSSSDGWTSPMGESPLPSPPEVISELAVLACATRAWSSQMVRGCGCVLVHTFSADIRLHEQSATWAFRHGFALEAPSDAARLIACPRGLCGFGAPFRVRSLAMSTPRISLVMP